MASYKYQQIHADGAEAGYVKYNITPAFDAVTALFPGDTFTVSGVLYVRDFVPGSVHVSLDTTDDTTEGGVALACGNRNITGKKAAEVAFVMSCTVPDTAYDLADIGDTLPCYLHIRASDVDGEIFSYDFENDAEQVFTVVSRDRAAPVISNVLLTDKAGYADEFGGFVQGQSYLHISFDVETDPLDPSLTIVERVFEIGTYLDDEDRTFSALKTYELNSNSESLGVLDISGNLIYELTVKDSYEHTSTSMLFLFDNGLVVGYGWETNAFTRPVYTGTAGGTVNTNDLTIKMPGVTGSNSLSFNAHMCTTETISIPASASTLNVRASKLTATATYLQFGMLPTNAPNSYSTANGGQLSDEFALTTDETVYTMPLSDAVKIAANMKCIINARANMKKGVTAASAIITSVWFE